MLFSQEDKVRTTLSNAQTHPRRLPLNLPVQTKEFGGLGRGERLKCFGLGLINAPTQTEAHVCCSSAADKVGKPRSEAGDENQMLSAGKHG